MQNIDPWLAIGVFVSTAATDAVCVMFNAAVSSKRRVPASYVEQRLVFALRLRSD